jgi:hypothetical protein
MTIICAGSGLSNPKSEIWNLESRFRRVALPQCAFVLHRIATETGIPKRKSRRQRFLIVLSNPNCATARATKPRHTPGARQARRGSTGTLRSLFVHFPLDRLAGL